MHQTSLEEVAWEKVPFGVSEVGQVLTGSAPAAQDLVWQRIAGSNWPTGASALSAMALPRGQPPIASLQPAPKQSLVWRRLCSFRELQEPSSASLQEQLPGVSQAGDAGVLNADGISLRTPAYHEPVESNKVQPQMPAIQDGPTPANEAFAVSLDGFTQQSALRPASVQECDTPLARDRSSPALTDRPQPKAAPHYALQPHHQAHKHGTPADCLTLGHLQPSEFEQPLQLRESGAAQPCWQKSQCLCGHILLPDGQESLCKPPSRTVARHDSMPCQHVACKHERLGHQQMSADGWTCNDRANEQAGLIQPEEDGQPNPADNTSSRQGSAAKESLEQQYRELQQSLALLNLSASSSSTGSSAARSRAASRRASMHCDAVLEQHAAGVAGATLMAAPSLMADPPSTAACNEVQDNAQPDAGAMQRSLVTAKGHSRHPSTAAPGKPAPLSLGRGLQHFHPGRHGAAATHVSTGVLALKNKPCSAAKQRRVAPSGRHCQAMRSLSASIALNAKPKQQRNQRRTHSGTPCATHQDSNAALLADPKGTGAGRCAALSSSGAMTGKREQASRYWWVPGAEEPPQPPALAHPSTAAEQHTAGSLSPSAPSRADVAGDGGNRDQQVQTELSMQSLPSQGLARRRSSNGIDPGMEDAPSPQWQLSRAPDGPARTASAFLLQLPSQGQPVKQGFVASGMAGRHGTGQKVEAWATPPHRVTEDMLAAARQEYMEDKMRIRTRLMTVA